MPIYEYRCGECHRKFEQVVLRGRALDEAACPRCGSHTVERLLSTFSMAGVSRKGEDSFDDEFDAPDDDFAGDLGGESDDDAFGEEEDEAAGGGEDDALAGGLEDGGEMEDEEDL